MAIYVRNWMCLIDQLLQNLEWANVVSEVTSEKMNAVKEAAHDTIADQYTWDKLADSFMESYKKLDDKREG